MLVHDYNPNTWETEAHRTMSLMLQWSTEGFPEQPGLHRVTPSYETKTKSIKETL